MNRILNLEQGRVMVVTDLHGNYAAYCRYRDHFLALRKEEQADVLLFCGDLIHGEDSSDTDGSLEIILDILTLRQELGENLILLLGNHELPHLYGITISKGSVTYGAHFERAMGEQRPKIIELFDTLPFYVRTRAGVSISHAGASVAATTAEGLKCLATYSHTAELANVDALLESEDRVSLRAGITKLSGESYAEIVAESLGITDPNHPRYDDVLRGVLIKSLSPNFQYLWEATFNKNEHEYGQKKYASILADFLASLSHGYTRQSILVSGHITVRGGHQVIADQQLRLASWSHASPRQAGQYLLFDASQPVSSVEDLLENLHSVFGER